MSLVFRDEITDVIGRHSPFGTTDDYAYPCDFGSIYKVDTSIESCVVVVGGAILTTDTFNINLAIIMSDVPNVKSDPSNEKRTANYLRHPGVINDNHSEPGKSDKYCARGTKSPTGLSIGNTSADKTNSSSNTPNGIDTSTVVYRED